MPGTFTNHSNPDPLDSAMVDQPSTFAGQVRVYGKYMLIKKGVKEDYNPAIHVGERPTAVVEFVITPLDPTHQIIDFSDRRGFPEWDKNFRSIVRPSVETLAPKIAQIRGKTVGDFNPLREIDELWIIGEFTQKVDNKPGETYTTLKFSDVFASKEECAEAYAAQGYELGAYQPPGQPAPTSQSAVANNPDRTAYAAFLPALWLQAGKNEEAFYALITANDLLKNVFNRDSPEVVQIVTPF